MAIGDKLLPGEQVFTPQMKAAGVKLFPSASTPPVGTTKPTHLGAGSALEKFLFQLPMKGNFGQAAAAGLGVASQIKGAITGQQPSNLFDNAARRQPNLSETTREQIDFFLSDLPRQEQGRQPAGTIRDQPTSFAESGLSVPQQRIPFFPNKRGDSRIPALEMLLGLDLDAERGAQPGTTQPGGEREKGVIEGVQPDISFSAGDLLRLEPRGTTPSPFGPPVPRELPEDDFLTPESMLAPSQIEAKGGFFSNLGKALATPGAAKFLIGLGAQIDPRGLSPLGEIGLQAADAEAERQFSEALASGTPQEQIQIPGLTAESRSRILAEREGREARATEEERKAQLFPRQLEALDQDIATGRIQAEEAKLKLDTIKRSMFESLTGGGAKSAQELIRLGAKAIGIPLADDLELPSNLTRDEAMDILTQAATTFRTRLNLAGRGEQRTILTGAARDARLNTLSSRYRRMLEVLETAETAGLNEFAQAQIIKVEDEILKLGGEIPTGQEAAEALPALDPQQSFNQMLQQLREGGAADQAAAPSDQPAQSAEVQKMLKDLRKKGFVPEDFPTTQDIINAHQALVKK